MPYKRFIWGTVILIILAASFLLREVSNFFFDAIFLIIFIMAAWEVNGLFKTAEKATYKFAICIFPAVLTLLLIICVLTGTSLLQFLLLAVMLTSLIFVGFVTLPYIIKRPALKAYRNYASRMSFSAYIWEASKNSMLAYIYPTILLTFLLLINHFNDFGLAGARVAVTEPNPALLGLLLVFVISMCSDSAAYVIGKTFPSRKISMEKLGKGKTWSGLIGGLIGGTLGGLALYGILILIPESKLLLTEYGFTLYLAIVAGFCGGVFTMLGDMLSSFIKRKAGVKDFSNLIPGHGGVMDRLNGIAINCVFIFFFILAMFA